MEKLAIVGIFFDGYYDIWEDFLELYERFCKDSKYPLYIVNNSAELEYKRKYNVHVLHAGKDAEYSCKVQKAIEEIDAEKYLLLLEDFFFTELFPNKKIEDILQFMDNNDIKFYSMPLPEFGNGYMHNKVFKKCDYLKTISVNNEYTITCQPAIWDKDFLKQCIGKSNYNAWIFEGIYCKSKFAHTEDFLKHCVVDIRNILGLRHGLLQGKVLPDTVKALRTINYQLNANREIMSKKEVNKYKIKKLIIKYLPLKIRNIIKSHVSTNSVIERYNNEIIQEMKKMGIE